MTLPINPTPAAAEAVTLSGPEAAKFTNLSAKTLERLAAAGEPVGRIKIGRRVVYLRSALETWLRSKAEPNTSQTSTN